MEPIQKVEPNSKMEPKPEIKHLKYIQKRISTRMLDFFHSPPIYEDFMEKRMWMVAPRALFIIKVLGKVNQIPPYNTINFIS